MVAAALLALVTARCSRQQAPADTPSQSIERAATSSSKVVGKGPRASGGFPAIVVLEPRTPREFPLPAEPKIMDQQGLSFIPRLLLVQQGQAVVFRNSEDVLHNVRVGETGSAQPVFNVATVPGNSYTHTFDRPGFYTVGCDVHQDMHADILVTTTPYAVIADDDGAFTLTDVSPGSYRLTVHQSGRRIERQVEVAGPQTELVVNQE
jgi:plastocyanin